MEDWFSNPVAWIFGLALAGLAWKVGSWTKEVDSNLNEISSNLSNINVKLNSFMTELRADFKLILERLPPATVFGAASPLQLTVDGQSISQTLDASGWAADIAPMLAQRVEGMAPYDIQEFCRSYVRDEFRPSPELEVKIKECAYQNALDRQSVLDVLMVELRDQLLPS